MDNKVRQEIDSQDLELVSGGLSDSRKAKLRDYVDFFKRRHYDVDGVKRNWAQRHENANLSAAELEEDYRYIEQIY